MAAVSCDGFVVIRSSQHGPFSTMIRGHGSKGRVNFPLALLATNTVSPSLMGDGVAFLSAYNFIFDLAWESVFCIASGSKGVTESSGSGISGKRVRSGLPKRAVAGGTPVVECGEAR